MKKIPVKFMRFININKRLLIGLVVGVVITLPTGLYIRELNTINRQGVPASGTQQIDTINAVDVVKPTIIKGPNQSSDDESSEQYSNGSNSSYSSDSSTGSTYIPMTTSSFNSTEPDASDVPIKPTAPSYEGSGSIEDTAYLQECTDKYNQRQAALTPIQQQIDQKTQELADLPEAIAARTANSLVTETQRQRLYAIEAAVIIDQIDDLQYQYDTLSYQYPTC